MSDEKNNSEEIILNAVRERVAFARKMQPDYPEKLLERLSKLEKLLCEQLEDESFGPNFDEEAAPAPAMDPA